MIPFVGTVLGAACVLFTRKHASALLRKGIEGFSAGVMIAASVWSLLIPSMEMAEERGGIGAIPAAVGLLSGIIFFLVCDKIIKSRSEKATMSGRGGVSKSFLPCFAIALHNLPEGMAVGAVYAELLCGTDMSGLSAAMALSIGIAVQNFPEGAIVSIPLYAEGMSKPKAFLLGALSGAVEPLGALLTILAAGIAVPLLPYLLGFAAGAMIYAVLDGFSDGIDKQSSAITMLTFGVGFTVMMSLDVILG